MAIYNIFDYSENHKEQAAPPKEEKIHQFEAKAPQRGRFFSSLAARFFFVILLMGDILWGVYASIQLIVGLTLNIITVFQFGKLRSFLVKALISLRRFLVCAFSLIVAVFSPSLGILFSCMYFMMYDKEGIDEVVPASLKEQFQEFFPLQK